MNLLLSGNALRIEERRSHLQRLVNRMFQKQIRASMEVYINDMFVNSIKAELHITHLAEAF